MPSPVTIIPCRAGSTEIRQKNFKLLLGQPLWAWTVGVAEHLGWPYLVTSDQDGYRQLKKPLEGHVFRGKAHGAAMFDVVAEAAQQIEGDPIVLLQPTSPFRTAEMVQRAVRLLRITKADSVAAVEKIPLTFSPDYLCKIVGGYLVLWDDQRTPTKRQDARPAYIRTGDVYVFWRKTLERGSLYGEHCHPMVTRPGESLSIDTPLDWEQAVLRARKLI